MQLVFYYCRVILWLLLLSVQQQFLWQSQQKLLVYYSYNRTDSIGDNRTTMNNFSYKHVFILYSFCSTNTHTHTNTHTQAQTHLHTYINNCIVIENKTLYRYTCHNTDKPIQSVYRESVVVRKHYKVIQSQFHTLFALDCLKLKLKLPQRLCIFFLFSLPFSIWIHCMSFSQICIFNQLSKVLYNIS